MGFPYRHSSIKNDLFYVVPNLYAVLSSVKDKNKRFLIMSVYCPCNESQWSPLLFDLKVPQKVKTKL